MHKGRKRGGQKCVQGGGHLFTFALRGMFLRPTTAGKRFVSEESAGATEFRAVPSKLCPPQECDTPNKLVQNGFH